MPYSWPSLADAAGIYGDGVHDDTSAVNTFLATFTSGQRVIVPPGFTPLINSGNLTVPEGVILEGASGDQHVFAGSHLYTSGSMVIMNPSYTVNMGNRSGLKILKLCASP